MTTEKFLEKAHAQHGDRYDYSCVDSPKAAEVISIGCKIHGMFTQECNSHINKGQGCPECGKFTRANSIKAKYDTGWFISQSRKIHSDNYDYSNVEYTTGTEHVNIGCKVHGVFIQEARVHMSGAGCPECAKANNNYWSYSGWTKAGEESNYFDGYKVYIVKMFDEHESFYKIGKTYNPVWLRFSRGCIPYEYVVLKTIEGSGVAICKLEEELLKANYEAKYIPKKEFAGSQECFNSIDNIKDIIDGKKE